MLKKTLKLLKIEWYKINIISTFNNTDTKKCCLKNRIDLIKSLEKHFYRPVGIIKRYKFIFPQCH